MRNLAFTMIFLCVGWPAMGEVAAMDQEACEDILEARTAELQELEGRLLSATKDLSSLERCTLDFDLRLTNDEEAVRLDAQIKGFKGRLATINTELKITQDKIKLISSLVEALPREENLNALLSERLAYRSEVKNWKLRNSEEVIILESEIAKLNTDLVALQDRVDSISLWQDQSIVENLFADEAKLTQDLLEVQRGLASVQRAIADPKYVAAKEFESAGPERAQGLQEAAESIEDQIKRIEDDIALEQSSNEVVDTRLQAVEQSFSDLSDLHESMKGDQLTATERLARAQIEKDRMSGIIERLTLEETVLSSELKRLLPQSSATKAIVDQINADINEKNRELAEVRNQIKIDGAAVANLQGRINGANQNIAAVRSQMSNEYKALTDFKNLNDQVFALEITIDGLDNEIDNLEMRAAGAEGRMNRFMRACRREPACKNALKL
jgi:chromosome segregation ATPase